MTFAPKVRELRREIVARTALGQHISHRLLYELIRRTKADEQAHQKAKTTKEPV